jgi:regulator of PEP synthase PpsR (kinase-PPPase family)
LKRTAFFISDGTGTTASSLGGLLAHFPNTQFEYVRLPFTDSIDKILDAQKRIAENKVKDNVRPIVIMSIGDMMLRKQLKEVDAFYIDLFDSFIDPLGKEFDENRSQAPALRTATRVKATMRVSMPLISA